MEILCGSNELNSYAATPFSTPRATTPASKQINYKAEHSLPKSSNETRDDADNDDSSSVSSTGPWAKRTEKTVCIDESDIGLGCIIQTMPTIQYDAHTFTISNGRIVETSPIFQTYLSRTQSTLERLWEAIDMLEKMTREYNIAWLDVSCAKLEWIVCQPMIKDLRLDSLMEVVIDKNRIFRYIKTAGSRFNGYCGHHVAASKIQATWKMHKQQKSYRKTMGKIFAGRCFLQYWRVRQRRQELRSLLKKAYARHFYHFKRLMKKFTQKWPSVKNSPRTIVHLPALSCHLKCREAMSHVLERQKRQLGRLIDVGQSTDECEVEIIYVVPRMDYGDERYYNSILDRSFKNHTVHYIQAENSDRFPKSGSLTNMLMASPNGLKELRQAIRSKSCYLVPGMVGEEEIRLCSMLDIPLMAPDHEIIAQFSKSGVRSILKDAGFGEEIPCAAGIIDEEGFFESLYSLYATNPQIKRWVFKVDSIMAMALGMAFLDTTNLSGTKEEVLTQMKAEICVTTRSIKNVQHFLYLFCHFGQGGVIEAVPCLNSKTIAVNVFIEPDSTYRIVGTADHIPIEPFAFHGAAFPQQHANHETLKLITSNLVQALIPKGVIGNLEFQYLLTDDVR